MNVVAPAIRLISARRAVISVLTDAASVELRVLFAASTASSRMRWSMEWTSVSAPSAVWTIETPSWAFRWAWLRPVTWAFSFSLMARPAASSAARLIRRPLDSFSTLLANVAAVALRFR